MPSTGPATTALPNLNVAVVIGSTRPGRRGEAIATWLIGQVQKRGDLDVDRIDLLEVGLPAVLPGADDAGAQDLRTRVDAADAFVVVTPEYNHGYPASLKQAIDVPYREWNAKPVGFVSYGGMSGGSRAVEQLRQVFAELHAVTVRDAVAFPGIRLDEQGNPLDADAVNAAAKRMLDQLAWWAEALRTARAAAPYPS